MNTYPIRRRLVTSSIDTEIAVTEYGNPDAETIVLVHGWPDSQVVWTGVAERLAERWHVVTFDQRGVGASSSITTASALDFDVLVADLEAVCRAVGSGRRVHLVGHDFGAIYAWQAVSTAHASEVYASFSCLNGTSLDHWGSWARAVLKNPTPATVVDLCAQMACSSYILWLFVPGFPRLAASVLGRHRVWSRALRLLSGVDSESVRLAPTLRSDMRDGIGIYRANVFRLFRPTRRWTDVPVQMIHGRRDVAIRRGSIAGIGSRAQTISFVDIDAGHWSPLTHTDTVAGLVERFAGSILAPSVETEA